MKRRRVAATGIAVAAIVGTAGPSWAFWTLTSDPTSTAGAKADTLNTPTVQSSRSGNGANLIAKFKVVSPTGAAPDHYTVFRSSNGTTFDTVPGCVNIPTTTTCQSVGQDNNGDKTYRITVTTGTFWTAPSYAVCQYLNNSDDPTGPQNFQCSTLAASSAARTSTPSENSVDLKSPAKADPAPALAPTAGPAGLTPAPDPVTEPTGSTGVNPPPVEEPVATPAGETPSAEESAPTPAAESTGQAAPVEATSPDPATEPNAGSPG
jgi:hypothetical protein